MSIATRPLGQTGTDVAILGYGAMELRGQPRGPAIDDEQAGVLLNAVLDGGINLIDTSIDYGRSEELIGRYLGHRRDEYFLASKCGCLLGDPPPGATPPFPHDFRPENIRAGIEQSLRRLGTDRLDLLQVHISPSREQMEADGTVETMLALRDEGKVRFIGMSGTLPHLPDHIAMGVFDVFQIPYSAVQREHEDLITAAAGAGAGTLIRGGAAARRAGGGQGLAAGPDRAVRRRRPAALGVLGGRGPARRHEPAGVRPALHAQPPRPVQHHRRDVEPGPPPRPTWPSPRRAPCRPTSTRRPNGGWTRSLRSSLPRGDEYTNPNPGRSGRIGQP